MMRRKCSRCGEMRRANRVKRNSPKESMGIVGFGGKIRGGTRGNTEKARRRQRKVSERAKESGAWSLCTDACGYLKKNKKHIYMYMWGGMGVGYICICVLASMFLCVRACLRGHVVCVFDCVLACVHVYLCVCLCTYVCMSTCGHVSCTLTCPMI